MPISVYVELTNENLLLTIGGLCYRVVNKELRQALTGALASAGTASLVAELESQGVAVPPHVTGFGGVVEKVDAPPRRELSEHGAKLFSELLAWYKQTCADPAADTLLADGTAYLAEQTGTKP
jgi:hypothetical protein